MNDYYRPTQGEEVGTWNVFHRSGQVEHGVAFDDLPAEVQDMIRQRWAS